MKEQNLPVEHLDALFRVRGCPPGNHFLNQGAPLFRLDAEQRSADDGQCEKDDLGSEPPERQQSGADRVHVPDAGDEEDEDCDGTQESDRSQRPQQGRLCVKIGGFAVLQMEEQPGHSRGGEQTEADEVEEENQFLCHSCMPFREAELLVRAGYPGGFMEIVRTAMKMNPSGKRRYSESDILRSL